MKKKGGSLFKNQKKERRLFVKKLILPNNSTRGCKDFCVSPDLKIFSCLEDS